MGFYRGPNIVTDGLVYAMDAGSGRSYDGTTTLNDLVGSNTGTLTNGVAYQSINGGVFYFDGTDDYIDIGSQCPTGSFSLSSWVYKEGTGGWYAIFSAGTEIWFGLNSSGRILAHVGGPLFQVSNVVDINAWHNCVLTWNGTTGIIYVDGAQVASSTSLDNPIATGYDIGRLSTSATHNCFNGKISNLLLYNAKALTQAEVTQNFNAQKSRFGL